MDHGEGSSPSVLEENEWKTIAQSRVILGVSFFFLFFSPDPVGHFRFLGEESSDYRPPNLDDGFKILLNRSERRRVAKLEGRISDLGASDSDASVVDDGGDVHSVGEGSHKLDDANAISAKSFSFKTCLQFLYLLRLWMLLLVAWTRTKSNEISDECFI